MVEYPAKTMKPDTMRLKEAQVRKRGDAGATRRSFLAGLAASSLAGAGALVGGARGSPVPVNENGPTSGAPFEASDEFESFVDDVVSRRIGDVTPGATIAVVTSDGPVLVKGYGNADVQSDVPVRADETAFRVGSVGKLVTWTAVMQGVERGVLDLDEDVNTYLEDSTVTVPSTYDEPVTLRRLGTHTAGFESALDPGVVSDPGDIAPLETVLTSQRPRRVRAPGELVGYSNYGAALAGHVVAEVHETTFEEYVQSEIFEPLGMTHSTFAQPVPDDQPGTLASGHIQNGETFRTADDVYINIRPAGSMSATARDMAAFMRAHLGAGAVNDTRILNAETVRTMHEQHHERHPAVTNWRYGFYEYGAPDADLIGHSGGTISFASHLVLATDHDVGIFVNYNSNDSESPSPAAITDEILAEYDLLPAPTPPSPTSDPNAAERAETVAGEYSLTSFPRRGPLQVVDLLARVSVEVADGGRLNTSTIGNGTRQWIETEPYVYREVDGHDVIAFEVSNGDVEVMHMASEPTGGYTPVPLLERQLVTGSVLGGPVSLRGHWPGSCSRGLVGPGREPGSSGKRVVPTTRRRGRNDCRFVRLGGHLPAGCERVHDENPACGSSPHYQPLVARPCSSCRVNRTVGRVRVQLRRTSRNSRAAHALHATTTDADSACTPGPDRLIHVRHDSGCDSRVAEPVLVTDRSHPADALVAAGPRVQLATRLTRVPSGLIPSLRSQ
jgi:CubicO group peptidase (beta-lactamase class C family)